MLRSDSGSKVCESTYDRIWRTVGNIYTFFIPRLTLQPILENAFEHGLETRAKDALLRVSFAAREQGLLIQVEDNGKGILDGDLERMQMLLTYVEGDVGDDITGIRNIHRRLQIYFKGKAGLRIMRSELGGVKAEIYIETGGEHIDT